MQIGLSRIKTSVSLNRQHFFVLRGQNIISNDSNDMTECKKSNKIVISKCLLILHDIPWFLYAVVNS